MTQRTDSRELTWNEPLEQDWPAESSNVRVVNTPQSSTDDSKPTLPAHNTPAWEANPDKAEQEIMERADLHMGQAVANLRVALAWLKITDKTDRADVLRAVEDLAETVAYRRSLL